MARYYCRLIAFAVVMLILCVVSCGAFQLLAPTDGQAVRETVKIEMPTSAVPDSGFISVTMGDPGAEKFVMAMSRDSAKVVGSKLVFFWNSKAPFFEAKDPMKPKFFKDGRYPLIVQVHEADGRLKETANVRIELKNRVARPNPAPGISLANKLVFGQINYYRIHCDVSIFEVVNRIGLPLFGGMGLSAESMVIQSVEDVRPGGEFLLRLREDEKAYVSSYGVKKLIYAGEELKPQLYRLVSKHGNVLKANMFAKQAQFQIMDILPSLPTQSVKEGDSWPDSMTLKVDGLTSLIKLKGSAMLDSFEWQNGRECAKITSTLSGDTPIWLANGKIQGAGPVNAEVTTYFAYKTGAMLSREIKFTFDATILPGAGDMPQDQNGGVAAPDVVMGPPPGATSPYDDTGQEAPRYGQVGASGANRGGQGSQGAPEAGTKKGKVELNIVVRLEK